MILDKRPALFIFDMDGLLFDTETLYYEVSREIFAAYGYSLTWEMHASTAGAVGAAYDRIMQRYFGDQVPFAEITEKVFVGLYARIERDGLVVKPGIEALLAYLRQEDMTCCVATSSPLSDAEHFTGKTKLRDYFSFLIGRAPDMPSKPDPSLFLKCLSHAGVGASDALILEDSVNGILAAERAGIPVICIPDMVMPEEEIRKKCVAVVERADTLIGCLPERH